VRGGFGLTAHPPATARLHRPSLRAGNQPEPTTRQEPVMPAYHVILTVVHRQGTQITFEGTVTPNPGSTRQKVFNDLLTHLAQNTGLNREGFTTLFFALDPDRLPGVSATSADAA